MANPATSTNAATDAARPSSGVVTRFAPSPTGFLHIGGARTALFNWLYARAKGGTFLLRIEDTDRARSTDAATAAILDGLSWLGLDWDGDAVSQFERAPHHAKATEAMLARGTAYRCYATREEIDLVREAETAAGRPPLFRSPWRDADPADAPADTAYVVRLKAPREGETVVEDAVQGRVAWKNETLDDLILLRSDGTPTYMLAVVVDDHEMGVTHVIRGDDHLTNAARQTLIYRALGWTPPVFAHIPLIHGADGAKLSKRHGALGVEAYREMGFLPSALRNYLAKLGWSHGDDEFFTTDQAIAWFDLDGVNKGAARFDLKKLEHLNGLHLRAAADGDALAALDAYLRASGEAPPSEAARTRLAAAAGAVKQRAKTLAEFWAQSYFAVAERPLTFDEKAAAALDADARAVLTALRPILVAAATWSHDALDAELRAFAEATGRKLGKIAQPLRAALTARAASPGVFDVLTILGREESLARLDDALARE